MTSAELVARVHAWVKDPDYQDSAFVLGILNDSVVRTAGLIALPDLEAMFDVMTSLTYAYAAMPATYHRGAHLVMSATQKGPVHFYRSFAKLLRQFPALDTTGPVTHAALLGRNLYYQGKPSSAESLKVVGYRKPTPMVLSGGSTAQLTPDGIPEEFHESILVHDACRAIYSIIEDGAEGGMRATDFHTKELAKGLTLLKAAVGAQDDTPSYMEDEGMYINGG